MAGALCGAWLTMVGCGSRVENGPPAAERSGPGPGQATKSEGRQRSGEHYQVNPDRSQLTAHVEVGGLLAAAGHPHTIAIGELRGDVHLEGGAPGSGSIQMTIRAGSLHEVGKEFDEKERRKIDHDVHTEALEISKHPEIVFKGTAASAGQSGEGQDRATIKGDLTLHGVTRQVSFPAVIRREGDSLRATGRFGILHSDYGIKRLSAAAGMVKAKDEILLTFDIRADRRS